MNDYHTVTLLFSLYQHGSLSPFEDVSINELCHFPCDYINLRHILLIFWRNLFNIL